METEQLLAAWRDAESAVQGAEAGSTEWHQARLVAEDAKAAYQAHIAELDDVAAHLAETPTLDRV